MNASNKSIFVLILSLALVPVLFAQENDSVDVNSDPSFANADSADAPTTLETSTTTTAKPARRTTAFRDKLVVGPASTQKSRNVAKPAAHNSSTTRNAAASSRGAAKHINPVTLHGAPTKARTKPTTTTTTTTSTTTASTTTSTTTAPVTSAASGDMLVDDFDFMDSDQHHTDSSGFSPNDPTGNFPREPKIQSDQSGGSNMATPLVVVSNLQDGKTSPSVDNSKGQFIGFSELGYDDGSGQMLTASQPQAVPQSQVAVQALATTTSDPEYYDDEPEPSSKAATTTTAKPTTTSARKSKSSKTTAVPKSEMQRKPENARNLRLGGEVNLPGNGEAKASKTKIATTTKITTMSTTSASSPAVTDDAQFAVTTEASEPATVESTTTTTKAPAKSATVWRPRSPPVASAETFRQASVVQPITSSTTTTRTTPTTTLPDSEYYDDESEETSPATTSTTTTSTTTTTTTTPSTTTFTTTTRATTPTTQRATKPAQGQAQVARKPEDARSIRVGGESNLPSNTAAAVAPKAAIVTPGDNSSEPLLDGSYLSDPWMCRIKRGVIKSPVVMETCTGKKREVVDLRVYKLVGIPTEECVRDPVVLGDRCMSLNGGKARCMQRYVRYGLIAKDTQSDHKGHECFRFPSACLCQLIVDGQTPAEEPDGVAKDPTV